MTDWRGRVLTYLDEHTADAIGELSGLFEHADVGFMGGTVAERGGHNITRVSEKFGVDQKA